MPESGFLVNAARIASSFGLETYMHAPLGSIAQVVSFLHSSTIAHIVILVASPSETSTDKARGLDSTVRPTSSNDPNVKIALDKLLAWKPSTDGHQIFELEVLEKAANNSTKTYKVYVLGALAKPESITGRATRGYPT
ncbi:hypothetical protein CVT25_014905 [Psilocybe cyanescens]|uniref:Uncharacterized protein n=1 Tax=Psilocybe cyanescens TaxID=93625 RepID=A0A409WF02_PSICY|nr:hypothetical protein CVT25_014905 [Psilocybe cyanescens]